MNRTLLLAGLLAGCAYTARGQTQLMINGGFELVNSGEWQITGASAYITYGPGAFSGMGYLSMGNAMGASQSAYQVITFPTNLIAATYSFNYAIQSSDVYGANDVLSAYILDTNRNTLVSMGSAYNTSGTVNSGYYTVSTNIATYTGQNNLSPLAGRTVLAYFQVTTDPIYGALTSFSLDNVSMLIGTTADIPANDNFAGSTNIPSPAFTNSFSVAAAATNTYASKEPGEPNHAGNPGGHSVWWNWIAPASGSVTLNTSGSSFVALLGVYIGNSVSNLTVVASNNGNNRGGVAQVSFIATAGMQYQIAVDGYNGQAGAIALNLKFASDTKAPTVSISSPASGAKLTNATVVVQGKATDNVAVALVEYRLENAAGTNDYQAATGTTNWSATVTNLIPGPNTIRVRATDTSGNISTTVARPVTFIVVSPITLTVNGSGSVSPNLNGQLLALGSIFKVTAKPGLGDIFAGWTGDIVTDVASLSFTMQSNLTLQANFIPNPFIPVAGTYQGLFFDTNSVAHQSSGFWNATVTSAGNYTAKIILAGANYSLSGHFSAIGVSSNSFTQSGQPRVVAHLQLDLAGGGLTGQLSNGVWTAELNSFRAMSNPPAGKYTLLIPRIDDDPAQPGGDGFGTVTIDAMSRVTFSGTAGDGAQAMQSTILTPGGQWPLYISPYSGKGSMLGWLTVSNQPDSDISGPVDWFRLPQPASKYYPAGFTNQTDVTGSAYTFTNGAAVLSFTNGQVWLAGGNLAASFTNHVAVSPANKVTNLSSNALTLTITTTSGLFKGSVVNPANGKAVTINGVLLEKQDFGAGTFSGTNQTGRVHLGP